MRDPTMQKPSSKAGSQERRNYQALLQQLKNLESEWESIEKSRQRTPRRCSSSAAPAASILALLDNSPRDLMSSLQHRESPSVGVLRLKNNSGMAVQEILMDRRAATMSGKLKPRRLFGPPETPSSGEELDLNYGSGGGDEICCDWLNMSEEREVSINENCSISTRNIVGEEQELIDVSKQSCSFSDSSLSEEKVVVQKEEEEKKTVVQEAIVAEKGAKVTGGGRHMAAMAWFGFVVILLILGFISMSCNGKYVHGNEFILVPT